MPIASLENALHLLFREREFWISWTLGDLMARAEFFAIHSSCWQNRKNAPQQQGVGEGGIWTCAP
jgi:hypothetical protein